MTGVEQVVVQQDTPQFSTVAQLSRAISTEILVAAGLPRTSPLQALLRPLVWPPAHRFARLAAEFDRRVALSGWTTAVRWALALCVDSVETHGMEQIPASGPLVIASNHPGSYDGLVIAATIARDDFKVIVSDIPFLRGMVATVPHFIYMTHDAHVRMGIVRESVRHLRAGGALLVYATGQVDPDPALLPGAPESLRAWSPSLALFLRQVPEAVLLPTIVSGVLAPSCYRHPLTRLRRDQRSKQFLAEFIQVGQQVLFDRRFPLTPTVRFAAPVTAATVDVRDAQAVWTQAVARAQALLSQTTAGNR